MDDRHPSTGKPVKNKRWVLRRILPAGGLAWPTVGRCQGADLAGHHSRGEHLLRPPTQLAQDREGTLGAERRESYLREDNARMLRLLTIHEAVPGHYLQLAYANRTASPVGPAGAGK